MARPSVKDPLDKFRWSVQIEGLLHAGFTNVEVPAYNISTKQYKEGGSHLYPKIIVDSISYKPVTLLRGVTSDVGFVEWAKGPFEILETRETNEADNFRRDVTIKHLNRNGNAVRIYTLKNAFPIEYQPASDFAGDGDDGISLERLVLAYESFEVQIPGQSSNPFSVKNIVKNISRNSF